jgi:TetR/AcrR family transcriptional regulator
MNEAVPERTPPRIRAADRRESILSAATAVFGERGYFGATTEQIAQAAGISQPYVVRMFGGKENLFLEVLERALEELLRTFRHEISTSRSLGEDEGTMAARMGSAYTELVANRGILLSLMHGFSMGSDPVIGARARECFLIVYRLLRVEAQFSVDATQNFLANGMLINTMLALRLPAEYNTDASAKELLDASVPAKLDIILRTAQDGRA